jgi:hypothetical protein
MTDRDSLTAFLALSEDLTGHSAHRLRGTGLAEAHLALLTQRAGGPVLDALLQAHATVRTEGGDDEAALARGLRHRILSDPRLGPPARGLLKLWYVGVWQALSPDWHIAHGGALDDTDTVPSPAAYTEGLLWPSIGANPAGAKPHGYGIWARPPRIPDPLHKA